MRGLKGLKSRLPFCCCGVFVVEDGGSCDVGHAFKLELRKLKSRMAAMAVNGSNQD
jgi:hypothetical protein